MRTSILKLSALALITANGCADTVFCWETATCIRQDSGVDSLLPADGGDGSVSETSASPSVPATHSAASGVVSTTASSAATTHTLPLSTTARPNAGDGGVADSSLPPQTSASNSASEQLQPDDAAMTLEPSDDAGGGPDANPVNTCPDTVGAERVCTAECPCAAGEGVCALTTDCQAELECVPEGGIKYGFAGDATCLPAHCDNDEQDADETSVDCGGDCGCLATFEVVELTGIPAGRESANLVAMSGDGTAFAGHIGDGMSGYAAAISGDGVIQELANYGLESYAVAITQDGNVVFGMIHCSNPPACSDRTSAGYSWTAGGSPVAVTAPGQQIRGISATGSSIAGYNNNDNGVFLNRSGNFQSPELGSVIGLSADGVSVVGSAKGNSSQAAIWSAKTESLTEICPTSWTGWNILAIGGTGPAVAGTATNAEGSKVTFLWKEGVLTELGTLDGLPSTTEMAISADGSVIVGTGTGTTSYTQAFIWRPGTGSRPIVDELRSRGLELPVDIQLDRANYISDDGTVIVGRSFGGSYEKFWRARLTH